jgi:hypothetical protein
MKYTIEAVDGKVIETLEIQGNRFTATWETGEDDGPFCSCHTVGKSLDMQTQEAFEYDEVLAEDVEDLISSATFLPNKFFDFVEAWGE